MAEENNDLNISVTNFKKFKLVFLGDQSVGKSSIISRYVYDTFEGTSNPTVGVDFAATDFTAVAKAMGGHGVVAPDRASLNAAITESFGRDTFTLISAPIGRRAYDGRI